MVDQAQRGDLQEVEGWTTDSPEELVWFMKSAGRWNVWQQIKVDARSWKPRMMWALCVVPLAVGWLVPLWYGPKGSAQPTATVILAEWAVKKFVYPGMELQVLAFVSPSQELSRVVGVRSPVRLG